MLIIAYYIFLIVIMNGMMKGVLSVIIMMMFLPFSMAQETKNVRLKNVKSEYSPGSYYINMVVDERNNQDDIGIIHNGGSRQRMVMDGGDAALALTKYINVNARQPDKGDAMALHIKKLNFDIRKSGNIWNIDCDIELAFYAGDKVLVQYTGGGKGQINTDPAEYAESLIRQSLDADMRKFDAWWSRNGDEIPVSSSVKVNFTIGRNVDESNLIVYSSGRPLRVDDFQGRTGGHNPEEMAATYSGNKYAYHTRTVKGQLVVDYTITPYFNISKSWFKQSNHNDHVLAHEQLHFDITALKTCEMVNRIKSTTFTKDNYQELLEQFSDDVNRATNDMQEQYDAETDHGIIEQRQKEWEIKVKKELNSINCY